MSRLRGAMSFKRKRSGPEDPSNQLTNDERAVFNLIQGKGDMGIWKGDIKRELRSINARVVDNCIKSLQAKRVIKEVVNIQSKGKNRLMSMEFEPSKELTGGAWYNEGSLDMEFITYLKKLCLGGIRKLKVATADGIQIHDMIKKSGAFKVDVSIQQIQDILKNLVLENEIFEVKSTGSGEFAHVPVGTACYKSTGRGQLGGSRMGAMASIPCGVCPRINQCADDGVISPTTCVYYTKWSEF